MCQNYGLKLPQDDQPTNGSVTALLVAAVLVGVLVGIVLAVLLT